MLLKEINNHIKTLKKLKAWVEIDNINGRNFYDKKGFKAINEKSEANDEMIIKLIEYELIYED